jgi:hypothetical protein
MRRRRLVRFAALPLLATGPLAAQPAAPVILMVEGRLPGGPRGFTLAAPGRRDGHSMRVCDRGPLRLVFPRSMRWGLDRPGMHERPIWQLRRLTPG